MWLVWFCTVHEVGSSVSGLGPRTVQQKRGTAESEPQYCPLTKHKSVLYSWYGGEPHIAQTKKREQDTRERQMGTDTKTINK